MNPRLIDAYELAASRPWLIQSDALENILRIARRQGDISALQTREGRRAAGATAVMRDGVAVIPVTGPIFRHANLFTEVSGATSTEMLAREIQSAADNDFVRAIVLDIHSPGGDATGIHELGELIHSIRAIKSIKAYIGGSGASAAYWLAAATDEVVVDATALVGSIGVVMTHRPSDDDQSIDIVSSQSPHKRLDLHSDEGRARVQTLVDRIAHEFIGAVARHRGVSIQTVIEKFGGGDVLVGADAVRAGMADRLGSLESLIAELASPRPTGKKRAAAPSPTASTPQESTMPPSTDTRRVVVSTTEQLHDAIAAGHSVEQITIASDLDRAAAARAEGVAEGRAQAAEEASLTERARITKIQSMTRPGFEALATTAVDDGQTPEQFAMAMFEASADRGITMQGIHADAPPPAAHAPPGDDSPPAPRAPNAAQVYQLRRAQTQAKR